MSRVFFKVSLIAIAALVALVPVSPRAVERFSQSIYPFVQSALTALSNLSPIALLDVLLGVTTAWWLWRLGVDLFGRRARKSWLVVTFAIVLRTAAVASLLYIAFVATWGLNYRREPLSQRLEIEPQLVTPGAAVELATRAVSSLNATHAAAHAEGFAAAASVSGPLADAFSRTQEMLAIPGARPAKPKHSMLDVYFRSAGVSGMTDPYFLETLVASDLLPMERPFVIAHEWSHLAGFANEGEANFLGWLTTMQGGPAINYSGWLFLYSEAMAGLPRDRRAAIAARLNPGPLADLRAIADRQTRHIRPVVAKAGWRVYDTYLKANRIEAGTASYAEVVRLILQTRFGPNWQPILKPRSAG